MSDGSRHSLAYIAETPYGQTPATPAFKNVRHRTTSLGLTRETLQSEELRSDRMIADVRGGTQQVGGDIEVELSYGSFDDFLAAVLCGEWVVDGGGPGIDRLKAGTVRRSFTLERNFGDMLAADLPYHRFTGCEFNTMEMAIAANAIITATFGVLGQAMSLGGTPIAGATYAAPTTTSVLDSFTGALEENGSPLALLTESSFTLDNGMDTRFVVGSRNTLRPSIGRSNVSGTASAFFENSTLLQKFLNETYSSISLNLPDIAGNSYKIVKPRIKYMGGSPEVGGEGPILLSMPYQALLDPVTGTNIYIDRNPA